MKRPSAIATAAVLRVGDGRGFVVESRDLFVQQWVITAAHCLTVPLACPDKEPPCLPRAHPGSYAGERTYGNLLGPLNGECAVWAECLFVDPIADIAVLGTPDTQAYSEESEAYDQLIKSMPVLPIAAPWPEKIAVEPAQSVQITCNGKRQTVQVPRLERPVPTTGRVHVLALDGQWRACEMQRLDQWLSFDQSFERGMSGSPILDRRRGDRRRLPRTEEPRDNGSSASRPAAQHRQGEAMTDQKL
jgi:hypothetical protein